MYKLRDYQEEGVNKAIDFFNDKKTKQKHQLIIWPTGAGKSILIAKLATSIEGNILVLQPSKELLEQNFKKITTIDSMLNVGIYSASFNSKEISKITLATIGSIYKKSELFVNFSSIIVDECDVINPKTGIYKQFLDGIGNFKMLGMTATPFRAARNSFGTEYRFLTRTRPRVFSNVLHVVQNNHLFNKKYLSELEYFKLNLIDSSQMEVNSTGMDYTDSSIKKYYENSDYYETTVDLVERVLKKRPNTLVFTKFVKEAEIIANKIGNSAAVVHAKTHKKERAEIIDKFKNGTIKCLVNVSAMGVGFDFPALSSIILARDILSLRFYQQFTGRGTRLFEGKKSCWIIDMGGAIERFGKIEDLNIIDGGNGKWAIENSSNKTQLTNVYF